MANGSIGGCAVVIMRALTFDVGGTLISPTPSVGHIYAQVAARHGVANLSPDDLNQRFARAWQEMKAFDYTRQGWSQLVDRTFAGLTATPPSSTFFAALYEFFARADAWQVFEDVHPALERLRQRGCRLGIISNWDDRLRPLLAELGLDHYFNAMTISCEAGATKPDRRIFERAAADLRCEPASILHIGDDVETDVRGAEAAGFAALELRRQGGNPLASQSQTDQGPQRSSGPLGKSWPRVISSLCEIEAILLDSE